MVECLLILPVIVVLAFLAFLLRKRALRVRFGLAGLALNLFGCMLWEYGIVGFVWNEGMKFYRGFGAFGLACSLLLCVLFAAVTAYNASMLYGEGRLSRFVLGFQSRRRALGAAMGLAVLTVTLVAVNPVMLFISENARGKRELDWLYGLLAAAVVLAAHTLAAAGVSAFMANAVKPGMAARAEHSGA